jgi:flagellar biosynthesis chaperone FliJ
LNNPDLPLDKLVKLAQTHKTLQKELNPIQEQNDTFNQNYKLFTVWGRLVDRGSDLAGQIQELGEVVQEQRVQFDKLSQEITGHLSANKISALPDAPTYENRLREILESIRAVKSEATEKFSNLQERYQQALMKTLNFPRDRLWYPHQYNPTAPDDSYQRLFYDVQKSLRDLQAQLSKSLSKINNDLQSALQSPALKTIPSDERTNIEATTKTLLLNIEQQLKQLLEIEQQLDNSAIIRDFPEHGEGQFLALLIKFKPVLEYIHKVAQEAKNINDRISQGELTDEGEKLFNTLPNSAQTELGTLRPKLTLSDNEIWIALRELHEKRRIQLLIEPIQ